MPCALLDVGGVSLELLGIGLLALDIAIDVRLHRNVSQPPPQTPLVRQAHEESAASPLGRAGGREPTLEERVRRLETRVEELEEETRARFARLEDDLRQEIGEVYRNLYQQTYQRTRQTQVAFSRFLGGSINRKLVTLALLVGALLLTGIAATVCPG